MTIAPQAIHNVFDEIQDTAPRLSSVLSGIGPGPDEAHYGYHWAADELPSTDYSRLDPRDRLGDPTAASALDISLGPTEMITVTQRLLDAAKGKDPRMDVVREFAGTTDGTQTHSYDLPTGAEGFGEWDETHLWHVHISFFREFNTNSEALAGVAAVVAGVDQEGKDKDMTPEELQLGLRQFFASREGQDRIKQAVDRSAPSFAGAVWSTKLVPDAATELAPASASAFLTGDYAIDRKMQTAG